jgi:hypothetical protein
MPGRALAWGPVGIGRAAVAAGLADDLALGQPLIGAVVREGCASRRGD